MKTYAFKVVKKDGKNLVSTTYHEHDFGIIYSKTEWNIPKIGKLFCFDDLDNAKHFAYNGGGHEVWLVQVLNPGIAQAGASIHSTGIRTFWEKKSDYYTVYSLPVSTIFVDAVRFVYQIV